MSGCPASLGVAGGAEQEERDALRPSREAADEEQRAPIRPMQIVQDEHEGPNRRQLLEPLGDGIEHPGAVGLRVGGRLARAACRERPETGREDAGTTSGASASPNGW